MAETLYCANHPGRETLLRCNKCGKPICPECAVRHPVGLRCRECAQLRRLPIYQVAPRHYLLGLGAGLAAATLAGLAVSLARGLLFSFWLLFLAGPAAGGFVAQAINRATGYRRGSGLAVMAAMVTALGYLVGSGLLWAIIGLQQFNTIVIPPLQAFADPFTLLYLILAAGTAAALLRR